MHRFGLWLTAIAVAVALVGLGLTVAPLSATIQVLCKGVSTAEVAQCNAPYAADMSKMHWRMYGGHNCTNYVAWQLGQNGVPEPNRLMGNARDWVTNAKKEGYTVNSTPAVGSVGAWGTSKNHVTYVVEVGANYIVTQEDNYPGYYKNGIYQKLKIYKGDSSYPTQFIHFKDLITAGTLAITGTPQVGMTLSANNGSWTPSGLAYAYRWLRDGVAIPTGTQSTYVLTPDDLGHAMAFRVQGSKSGYVSAIQTSTATTPVDPGNFINSQAPTIAGESVVDSQLSLTAGTWVPAGGTISYQWTRNGVAIPNEIGAIYTTVPVDVGQQVGALVTTAMPGYTSMQVMAAGSATVKPGTLTNATPPTVTGTPQAGSTLTSDLGVWSPPGTTLARQWLADGTTIAGATGQTYSPAASTVGKAISLKVAAARPGYTTLTKTSAPTARVAAAPKPASALRLSGGPTGNRYDTAAAVSKATFQPGVATVFIAQGDEFADGLSGGPAAARLKSPLLLVPKTSSQLPATVVTELKRLKPKNIYVLGGTGAIDTKTASELGKFTAGKVVRMAGGNRYETSGRVVDLWKSAQKVYLAAGTGFPDALSGGAAAARQGAPLLLTDSNQLADATSIALKRLNPSEIVITGGTAAISNNLAAQVQALLPAATLVRLAGTNRYDTSAKALAYSGGGPASTLMLASGANFPDALTGIPAATMRKAGFALTQSTCIPPSVAAASKSVSYILLGGPGALRDGMYESVCRK